MKDPKTFIDFINEKTSSLSDDQLLEALNESYKHELTPEEEAKIDEAIDAFVKNYLEQGKDINNLQEDLIKEGLIGSVLGGLAGFALGKSVGKIIAKVLGVERGVLYEMLTSRLVGAALGSALGSKMF
jgi:hypothetical protein